MLEFSHGYATKPHRMTIDIWQFLNIFPQTKHYDYRPMMFSEDTYRESYPVCGSCRGVACVTAAGDITPCLEMHNFNVALGINHGNVKAVGLKKLLKEGAYVDSVCTTIKQLAEHNEQCRSYRWWKLCAGGCRMFALGFTKNPLGVDKAKCVYFEKGYLGKIDAAFEGSGYRSVRAVTHSHEPDEQQLPDDTLDTTVRGWIEHP